MAIQAKYNKESMVLELWSGGKMMEALEGEALRAFEKEFCEAAKMLEMDRKIQTQEYQQLILEDIDGFHELSEIRGISMEIDWMYRLETVETSEQLVLKNGDRERLDAPVYLAQNFTKEQGLSGKISSRQIRRCFDECLMAHIEKTPYFKVWVNGQEVPRESLLSDEKEAFFRFERNGDT